MLVLRMMAPFNAATRTEIEARVAEFTRLEDEAISTQELKRAAVALVLARAALEKFGGDSLTETRRNIAGYLRAVADREAFDGSASVLSG